MKLLALCLGYTWEWPGAFTDSDTQTTPQDNQIRTSGRTWHQCLSCFVLSSQVVSVAAKVGTPGVNETPQASSMLGAQWVRASFSLTHFLLLPHPHPPSELTRNSTASVLVSPHTWEVTASELKNSFYLHVETDRTLLPLFRYHLITYFILLSSFQYYPEPVDLGPLLTSVSLEIGFSQIFSCTSKGSGWK